jgi:hypothetical protein
MVPCDCLNGLVLIDWSRLDPETVVVHCYDSYGQAWRQCDECHGAGKLVDEDLATAVLGGML